MKDENIIQLTKDLRSKRMNKVGGKKKILKIKMSIMGKLVNDGCFKKVEIN